MDNVSAWNIFLRDWAARGDPPFLLADWLTQCTGVDVDAWFTADCAHSDDAGIGRVLQQVELAELMDGWREVEIGAFLLGRDRPKGRCMLLLKALNEGLFAVHIYEVPEEIEKRMQLRGPWPGVQ